MIFLAACCMPSLIFWTCFGFGIPAVYCIYLIQLQRIRNRYLRLISDSIAEGIIIINSSATITAWSKGAENIFGYSKDEIIGKNLDLIIPGRMRERFRDRIKLLQGGHSPKLINKISEFIGLKKNGQEIEVEVSLSRTEMVDEYIYIGIIRDISTRLTLIKETSLIEQTLATRVNALEQFNYMVAHDLNAPLRTIEGFLNIIIEDYSQCLDDIGRDYINKVKLSCSKMRGLISDLIRLSRLTSSSILHLNKSEFNLSEVAEEINKKFLEANLGRDISVTIEPNMIVTADKSLMTIVLENLISNAYKFSSKKQSTKIRIGRMIGETSHIYFVKDNGAGFDTAKYSDLFQPFKRLHTQAEFGGNGIGLVSVKRIISMHDGRVWAESSLGEGATFYFTLGS
jgi:PAS domain S-box-containing protein